MFVLNLNRVKEERKARGLSQQMLADTLFIDQATYNKMENGKVQPNADMLFRIGQKLDIKVTELMIEVNKPVQKYQHSLDSFNQVFQENKTAPILSADAVSQLKNLLQESLYLLTELEPKS